MATGGWLVTDMRDFNHFGGAPGLARGREKTVKNFLTRTIRCANFLASCWIFSMRKLHEAAPPSSQPPRTPDYGHHLPARTSDSGGGSPGLAQATELFSRASDASRAGGEGPRQASGRKAAVRLPSHRTAGAGPEFSPRTLD